MDDVRGTSASLPYPDCPSASQRGATRLIAKLSPPHRPPSDREPWAASGSPNGDLLPMAPPITPRDGKPASSHQPLQHPVGTRLFPSTAAPPSSAAGTGEGDGLLDIADLVGPWQSSGRVANGDPRGGAEGAPRQAHAASARAAGDSVPGNGHAGDRAGDGRAGEGEDVSAALQRFKAGFFARGGGARGMLSQVEAREGPAGLGGRGGHTKP